MLILKETDIRACLSMKDCIDINRKALMSLANATPPSTSNDNDSPTAYAKVPSRLGLPYYGDGSKDDWTLIKPAAYYDNSNSNNETTDNTIMGMKLVSVRDKNSTLRNLPMVPATVMMVDAPSGIVNAILSATYLTAARTAAGSAIATDLCVLQNNNDDECDISHLVIFGAGLQAETHIDAISTIYQMKYPTKIINKITIINRSKERAEQLKEKVIQTNDICNEFDIILLNDIPSIHDALSTADVICTTTNTETPLFSGDVTLKPGCHINGIGSYTPTMCEIPNDIVTKRCYVLYDTPEAKNVGDLKHLLDTNNHPMTLLGDALQQQQQQLPLSLFNNNKNMNKDINCTFYKAVGNAIQDVMTASSIIHHAKEMGIGMDVDMN